MKLRRKWWTSYGIVNIPPSVPLRAPDATSAARSQLGPQLAAVEDYLDHHLERMVIDFDGVKLPKGYRLLTWPQWLRIYAPGFNRHYAAHVLDWKKHTRRPRLKWSRRRDWSKPHEGI
jgi:hypothetical protein